MLSFIHPRAALVGALLTLSSTVSHALDITTQRYDQNRTAANLQETVLGKSAVQGGSFGKQGAYAVDGLIFAHPLYKQGVQVGAGTYNVLFVATMRNVIYAFDADRPGSAPLWKRDLRTTQSTSVTSYWPAQIGAEMGIMSTPVIDASTGEMFFTSYAQEGNRSVYRLYAVNIRTGADTKPPVIIEPTQSGRQLDHPRNYQRAGLALAGQQVWIAFGGNALDTRPYTGWILSYDKTSLQRTGQMRTSVFDGATIWQGGGAPPVDANGNIYLLTANGWGPGASSYDGVSNFAQTMLKLGPTASTLIDHFTPAKQPVWDVLDQDFSTNTPVLIPGTDLVTAASKVSDIFVARTGNLGRQTPDNRFLVQSWRVGTAVIGDGAFNEGSRVVGTVYWNRTGAAPLYYVWPGRDRLRMYSFDGQRFSANAVVTGNVTGAGEPGIAMSLSANGSVPGSGVLWASRTTVGASAMNLPSVLEAYDAENPSQRLWSSADNVNRDGVGSAAKFVIPTVANGRVYLPTQNGTVLVYGLLPDIGLASSTSSVTATAGDSASLALGVSGLNGFSGAVRLSASAPSGINATFSQASLATGGSSTVYLSVAPTVAAGSYPVTLTATSAGLVRSTVVTVRVAAASGASFSLGSGIGSITVNPGANGTVTVQVGAVGGFTAPVALSVSGLPAGVTADFLPASISGAGTSVLTVRVAATAALGGQSAIVIGGTSGALVRQTVVNLNIGTSATPTPPPTATAPAAPGALAAIAAAPNSTGASVSLRWTDNSTNETSFVIQRSTSADFSTDPVQLLVSANATTTIDSQAAPSTMHYYRVRASNNGAESGYSNVASVYTAGQLLDSELNDLRTPRKIMALGDSITMGYVGRNYLAPLWTRLRDNGCAADFVGSGSWNDINVDTDFAALDGLRADTAASTYAGNWAQAAQPDVVLLHLGSFDAYAGVPAATISASIGRVIDAVRAVRPNAIFYVAKLIPASYATYNANVSALNALIPALVASKSAPGSPVILVDQSAGFTNTGTDLIDGIRPTAAGAQKMASKWYDALVANGHCVPTATMANLSQGKAVTNSGSQVVRPATPLVNGIRTYADEWVGYTAARTPQAIEVDLGASRTIGLFSLSHYTGTGAANIYNARDFRIAVRSTPADAWKDVVAVASNAAGRTLHPVAPVSARYVRLTLMRPNSIATPYNYSTLREFEVFGW